MPARTRRPSRSERLLALAASAVAPLAAAGTAHAATYRAAHDAVCFSSSNPALATKLAGDIDGALAGRRSTVAVAVYDRASGTTCELDADTHFDSASVVKVAIMGTLLRQAADEHRGLTGREQKLLQAMITRSDNNAASALWSEVGHARFARFLRLAGMTETVPGRYGYWGLTRITARDEMKLLSLLTSSNPVLSDGARSYALNLMSRVVPAQRWGVTAGARGGDAVSVKNGWLPEPTHGWRINSIGTFANGADLDQIVVLTQDNPSRTYGIRTVSNVARAIHHDLKA